MTERGAELLHKRTTEGNLLTGAGQNGRIWKKEQEKCKQIVNFSGGGRTGYECILYKLDGYFLYKALKISVLPYKYVGFLLTNWGKGVIIFKNILKGFSAGAVKSS